MFISSLWYPLLTDDGNSMDAENWLLPFPGSNPLEKKIIFVPMNVSGGSHWALAVIVNAAAIQSGIAYANCNYGTGKVAKEF